MNNNQYTNEEEISLSELYGIVKPYLVHIVLISIIFSLMSFIITKTLIKPIYESSATIIVNNRRDENQFISSDELNSARNLASVYGIVITSNAVMEPVINELEVDLTMDQLSKKVSVTPVDNTQVIKISVKDQDPELARVYTNEIIKVAPDIMVEMVEAGSVKVVSYPQEPTAPISPNVKMNVLVAGMLGFMLSIGFVFMRFLLDKTFRNAESVENTLGIPVIGVIPNLTSVKGGK